jgi:hypothetical protein
MGDFAPEVAIWMESSKSPNGVWFELPLQDKAISETDP